MLIREVRSDEIHAIAKINVDVFCTTGHGIVPEAFLRSLDPERAEARFRKLLAREDLHAFIYVAANSEGQVIGYAMAGRGREDIQGIQSELYGIYINPEFHRSGVGRSLIHEVVRRLQSEAFV